MASSSVIQREDFGSSCFSLSFGNDPASPYFAASFMDGTVRIWNLDDIAVNGKSLDEVACTIKDAVEIGPVDLQLSANRLGVSSMDGSLKVYDLQKNDQALRASLVVDSNTAERPSGEESQYELDAWKFFFNPRNTN